jgi:hypothetical protein
MKKALLVILGLTVLFLCCAKKKEAPSIKLSQPKWSETNKYQIVVDTTPSGTYMLTNKTSQFGNEAIIELTAVTLVKSINGDSRDSSSLILHKDNLKPIKSTKIITSRGATLSSEITYTDNKAIIKAKLPSGDKSITIPIGPNSFDNDEITFLMGAIDLKVGDEKELSVVIGLSGTSIPIKIKGIGEEKIKVPAGEFDCRKYEMNLVDRAIDVWYEKAESKRMIKYVDTQSNMAMILLP